MRAKWCGLQYGPDDQHADAKGCVRASLVRDAGLTSDPRWVPPAGQRRLGGHLRGRVS